MDLQTFLNSLRDLESDDKFIDYCRKYVLHGTPYIFLDREDEYYEFRKRIANKFKVAFNEVFITGSAKMGFSPFKEKQFDYESDIDVAIVSNRLYEEILESIRYYQMELRQARRSVTTWELNLYHQFLEYIAMGWIRPDKLPLSFQIKDFKD
jgi:predicted nucleotidyltransferase